MSVRLCLLCIRHDEYLNGVQSLLDTQESLFPCKYWWVGENDSLIVLIITSQDFPKHFVFFFDAGWEMHGCLSLCHMKDFVSVQDFSMVIPCSVHKAYCHSLFSTQNILSFPVQYTKHTVGPCSVHKAYCRALFSNSAQENWYSAVFSSWF